ncbi:MAG: SPOR domain-containing protein [Kordiimonas sp.]
MTNEDQTDLTAGKDIPPWLQPVPEGEDEAIEAAARRRKLLLTSGAAVGVIGLFTAVILYLYEGADPVAPRHVAAPNEPVRERPSEVGGMQVAHQDKEVFNQVDGDAHRSDVQLGAQPEEPVRELPEDPPVEESTEVDDAIASVIQDVEAAKPAVSEPVVQAPAATQPAAQTSTPSVSTAVPTAEADAKVYRVQLGAYGSEESAGRAWRLVRGKFSTHLTGKSPSYEAVQSGSRTLYRLRVGPLETRAEADQVCLALRAGQQACIVVNP